MRATDGRFPSRQPHDYYRILGIPETASVRDIELAYWKKAFRARLEDRRLLNEAYEVLSDVARREAYDAERKNRGTGPHGW